MQEQLHPVRSVAELTFGAFSPRKRPEDFRELREAFKEAIIEKEAGTRLKPRGWREPSRLRADS